MHLPPLQGKVAGQGNLQRKIRQKQYFLRYLPLAESTKSTKNVSSFRGNGERLQGIFTYTFEIGQYWWNAQGRKTIIAVQRTLGRYIDNLFFLFANGSTATTTKPTAIYRISPIYPKFKVTDTLRRNGLRTTSTNIVPTELIPALLSDSRMETLLKSGQTATQILHAMVEEALIAIGHLSASVCETATI